MRSARDISDGGIAVALAQAAFPQRNRRHRRAGSVADGASALRPLCRAGLHGAGHHRSQQRLRDRKAGRRIQLLRRPHRHHRRRRAWRSPSTASPSSPRRSTTCASPGPRPWKPPSTTRSPHERAALSGSRRRRRRSRTNSGRNWSPLTALSRALSTVARQRRQAARRVRRHRHSRPSRRRPPGLSRPLRPAASRTGVGRHRHRRRPAPGQHQGHGPGLGDLHRRRSGQAARPDGHRPHALLDHRRLGAAECAAHPRRIDQRPDRHRPQRQSGQPGQCARAPGTRRRLLPDHLATPRSSFSSSPTPAPARWSTPSPIRFARSMAHSPS